MNAGTVLARALLGVVQPPHAIRIHVIVVVAIIAEGGAESTRERIDDILQATNHRAVIVAIGVIRAPLVGFHLTIDAGVTHDLLLTVRCNATIPVKMLMLESLQIPCRCSKGQTACKRGTTSRSIAAPDSILATSRSYACCRLSQTVGDVPSHRASRNAVSALIARRPRRISEIRFGETPSASATQKVSNHLITDIEGILAPDEEEMFSQDAFCLGLLVHRYTL